MTTQIERNRQTALVVYILYSIAFLTGITALIGVIIAYIKREESKGTWLEFHYNWQINTFWITAIFMIIGFVTQLILIGFIIMPLTALWFLYRIIKGWLALNDSKAVGVEIIE